MSEEEALLSLADLPDTTRTPPMSEEEGATLSLADLPDPCLLAVLQCCAAEADDHRSLFSAARTHSRLHQAAVAALSSITAHVRHRRQVDSVLLYLHRHARHVGSLDLRGTDRFITGVSLCQLPPHLQLSSLQLDDVCLQEPARGLVLGAAALAALKQLRLSNLTVYDSGAAEQGASEALAAALLQLPAGLEHLSIRDVYSARSFAFPAGALQHLQQLTFLELAKIDLQQLKGELALQPLQALTRLVDLRLAPLTLDDLSASMLSGTHRLTHLESRGEVEPAALAGKTQLQHLQLYNNQWCSMPAGAAGVAGLLSYLQHLQQLTHLDLTGCIRAPHEVGKPSAAAYSALTASSTLQHLSIRDCTLPVGGWQHVFPTGSQLPHLQSLDISWVKQLSGRCAPAPEGSRLVSCCPALQYLDMKHLQYSAELLSPLQGLSGLHTLLLYPEDGSSGEVEAVCQLTGLRQLTLACHKFSDEGVLLQLTQLKQLTCLGYSGWDGASTDVSFSMGPSDEPVWRQLLQLVLSRMPSSAHPHP